MIGRLSVALMLAPAIALAAPRVGVVVVAHPGLTDEVADEIGYDFAAEVASRIEGEAIAGQSVRDALGGTAPEAACFDDAGCARELGAKLKVDEVLLLSLRKGGHTTVAAIKRVPRDPQKPVGDETLALPRGKRGPAIAELVARLYAPGSVTEFVAAPPPPPVEEAPPPKASEPAVPLVPKAAAPAPQQAPPENPNAVWRKPWFWGVVGGGAAATALAIILGVSLGTTASPSAPSVTLP